MRNVVLKYLTQVYNFLERVVLLKCNTFNHFKTIFSGVEQTAVALLKKFPAVEYAARNVN